VVGYSTFSLWVIHKEVLRPSSGDINRLMMMMIRFKILSPQDIEEGLILMMGGILTTTQANYFKSLMKWEQYEEEECIPDDIKLTLLDTSFTKPIANGNGDNGDVRFFTCY
jgi:hypothetical protein